MFLVGFLKSNLVFLLVLLIIGFHSGCSGNPVEEPSHPNLNIDAYDDSDDGKDDDKASEDDLADDNDQSGDSTKDDGKSTKTASKKVKKLVDMNIVNKEIEDFFVLEDQKFNFCKYISKVVTNSLNHHIDYADNVHYDHRLSTTVFDNLIRFIDPYKVIFLKKDVDFLAEIMGISLLKNIKKQDCFMFVVLGVIFRLRSIEYIEMAQSVSRRSIDIQKLFDTSYEQLLPKVLAENNEVKRQHIKSMFDIKTKFMYSFSIIDNPDEKSDNDYAYIKQIMKLADYHKRKYQSMDISYIYHGFLESFFKSLDRNSFYNDMKETYVFDLIKKGFYRDPGIVLGVSNQGLFVKPYVSKIIGKNVGKIDYFDIIHGEFYEDDSDDDSSSSVKELGYFELLSKFSSYAGSMINLVIRRKKHDDGFTYEQFESSLVRNVISNGYPKDYYSADHFDPYFNELVDVEYEEFNMDPLDYSDIMYGTEYSNLFNDKMAVLRIEGFSKSYYDPLGFKSSSTSQKVLSELSEKIKEDDSPDGLVIDLRNNHHTFLSDFDEMKKILELFLSSDTGLLVELSKKGFNSDYYSYSMINGKPFWLVKLDKSDSDDYLSSFLQSIPLVVLVDHMTAGLSEVFAQTLRLHNRAVIVGESKTSGIGGTFHQNFVEYSQKDNSLIGSYRVTVGKIYGINGKSVNINGLTPDITIPSLQYYTEFFNSLDNSFGTKLQTNDIKNILDVPFDHSDYKMVNQELLHIMKSSFEFRAFHSPYFKIIRDLLPAFKLYRQKGQPLSDDQKDDFYELYKMREKFYTKGGYYLDEVLKISFDYSRLYSLGFWR